MGRFIPGARIGQSHGTLHPVDPATGAASAVVYAMYHPAAALRATEVERISYEDAAGIPAALLEARRSVGKPYPCGGPRRNRQAPVTSSSSPSSTSAERRLFRGGDCSDLSIVRPV